MLSSTPRNKMVNALAAVVAAVITASLAACASSVPGAAAGGSQVGGAAGDADGFLVVDCLLPGQVRKLGRQATYLSARRPIKTTQSDCEIRGGEYIAYDRADYRAALAVWKPAADAGDPVAQTYLGEIYERGLGTAADYAEAAKWYRQAADAGNARAQINLGHLYEGGLGVQKDSVTALNWYRKASGLDQDQLAFTSSIEQLQQQIDTSDRRARAAEAEAGALRRELGALRGRLRNQDQSLNQRRIELEVARKALDRAQPGPAAVPRPVAIKPPEGVGVQDPALDKLAQEVVAKETEIDRLIREKGRLQQQATLLETRLGAESKGKSSLKQEIDQLQQQLVSSQAELTRERQQGEADLNAERERLAKARRTLEETQNSLEREQLALAGRDNAELQRLSQQVQRQQEEISEKQTLIDEIEQQNATQSGRDQALARQRSNLKAAQNQLADARAVLAQYRTVLDAQNSSEIDTLKSALKSQQEQIREQQDRNRKTEDALRRLNERLADTEGRAEEVDEQKQSLEDELQPPIASSFPPTTRSAVNFGSYYALVIGNNSYGSFQRLKTAVNDATDLANVLRQQYGFSTRVLTNADRYQVLSALNDFRGRLTENDNFLLYYAGHGELDRANDRGHWLPVDAEPGSTARWISNTAITDILNAMTAKHVMVIADSCYAGTLTRAVTTSIEGGRSPEQQLRWLELMVKTRSRTVLTSGGLKPVLDGGGGRNSIFAKHLLNVLRRNDQVLEGPLLYRTLADRVKTDASRLGADQRPQYSPMRYAGDLGAPFLFRPVGG